MSAAPSETGQVPSVDVSSKEYQKEWRAKKAEAEGREPGKAGRPPTKDHGSYARYRRHKRDGEKPCDECEAAYVEYQSEQYQKRKARKRG